MSTDLLNRGPVLVIGVSGQLGREFLAAFRALGIDAVAACRDPRPGDIMMDLARPQDLAQTVHDLRPSIVVNAAAYTAVDLAEEERVLAGVVNAEAPGVLAAACRKLGALLLHFSTDYVFDGRATKANRETDASTPINVYGRSKLEGEKRVLASGANHLVFRTSGLYEVHGNNFVATMLRLFRSLESVGVVNDQVLCPTSARHLAGVIVEFLAGTSSDELGRVGGLYHLCAAGETSWYEFAKEIHRNADPPPVAKLTPITSAEFGAPAPRPAFSVLDCSLAREKLGICLPHWRDQLVALMPEFNRRASREAG